MLKKILLILSLVSVSLMGVQSSRVNALSGHDSSYSFGNLSPAPLSRASIYDPSDVILFPHLANKYSDFINVYYAGGNNFNGFGTFNIMSGLTLGVADYNGYQQLKGVEGITDTNGNPLSLSDHTYSIFAAYGLGNMNIGLSFDYWASNAKVEHLEVDTSTNQTNTLSRTINTHIATVKASFGMDLGANMGFDSLFKIDLGGYANEAYDSTIEDPKTRLTNASDAYTSITVGGRFFMNLSTAVKMTSWGFLDYNSEGFSEVSYNTEHKRVDTVKHTDSLMLINLGTAFDIETIKNKLIVTPRFGILILSYNETSEDLTPPTTGSKEENSIDRTLLPYLGFSVEYSIKKWLTLYTGYSKVVYNENIKENQLIFNNEVKQSDITDKSTQGIVNSNFSIGVSLQNDVFKFIATLNKELLTSGPNFISGVENTMFLNATLQYKFGAPENRIAQAPVYSTPKTKKIVETERIAEPEVEPEAKPETKIANTEEETTQE